MPHIFLIGARASGKTTLGRQLAEHLNLPFVDMDQAIEKALGTTIAEFVRGSGWEAFRAAESDVLAELCATPDKVVATGGGVVLAQENRELLHTCGLCIYLQARAAVLLERLREAPLHGQRPPLTALPLEQELEKTLEERHPLYSASADVFLDASIPLKELLQQAMNALQTIHGAHQ